MSEHSLRQDWRLHAACRDRVDPEVPFAASNTAEVRQFIDAFCTLCPVAEQCLQFALRVEAPLSPGVGRHGVFGGFTGEERVGLVRRGVRACVVCRRMFVPHHRHHVRCPRHVRVEQDAAGREHGSEAGYQQHKRRNEEICGPCRSARSAAESARRRVGAA